jgi:hypothetical protein
MLDYSRGNYIKNKKHNIPKVNHSFICPFWNVLPIHSRFASWQLLFVHTHNMLILILPLAIILELNVDWSPMVVFPWYVVEFVQQAIVEILY